MKLNNYSTSFNITKSWMIINAQFGSWENMESKSNELQNLGLIIISYPELFLKNTHQLHSAKSQKLHFFWLFLTNQTGHKKGKKKRTENLRDQKRRIDQKQCSWDDASHSSFPSSNNENPNPFLLLLPLLFSLHV